MDLRKAIERSDVVTLKKLVYPFKDSHENMQEAMIESMLNGNENRQGDGAFSMRALDSLLGHHMDKISPIDSSLYDQLSHDIFFGEVISNFDPINIFVLDHLGVHIILLKENESLQLLFWENLNNLIHHSYT